MGSDQTGREGVAGNSVYLSRFRLKRTDHGFSVNTPNANDEQEELIMYRNYGDIDFFEYGILIDTEHSDTEFEMLLCRPYPDEEDFFQFAEVTVDITDDWMDREAIMDYIGMTEDKFDPVEYAIGAIEYYSWDNFGAGLYDADWTRVNRDYIEEYLRHRLIASDNLHITW
jgi:hypothetical protein